MNMEIVPSESGKQNPAAVYLRSLTSPASRRAQQVALNIIARKLLNLEDVVSLKKDGTPAKRRNKDVGGEDYLLFPWQTLRYEHTSAIQTWLLTEYKASTAKRMIAAVAGALKAAKRTGLMSADDYFNAVDLQGIGSTSGTTGRMLSPEEVAALLATCVRGGPTKGTRDAAMIMLMVIYTARRAEITTLQYSDYTQDYKPGVDRLVIHGKGRKDRVEFLSNGEREILTDWLKLRGSEPGPMFYVVLKSDEIVKHALTPAGIYMTVLRRMKMAGIERATVHDLRRTAISNLLDVTDALTVARMAGHSSPLTTMKYDKRPEKNMIEALSKLHLPFRREDRLVEG
jgi:integrase